MKKKHRCFIKRFAALVAALVISLSLPVSALAASDTEADMPSLSDFKNHYGSWFVWRERRISSVVYYELASSPIFFTDSGSVSSSSTLFNFSSSFFDISLISGDDTHSFACAYPVPLMGSSGYWSALPSFPVGRGVSSSCCVVCLYSTSDYVPSSYSVFLSPYSLSSGRFNFSSSSSDSSQTDTFVSSVFPSFSYSYPFAFRSDTSSIRTSYVLQGGSSNCISFSDGANSYLGLQSTRFVSGTSSFVPPPYGFTYPSSDLGIVLTTVPVPPAGGTINSASQFVPSKSSVAPTLLVPVGMLPDVKLGDWISDSPEDLQDAITNEFGVDSGKLKDSKDSLNSWNSTSSVDTDLANTSLSTINALFQNLGQFLAIVSLMVFGAVVLRMLIRKAVDG